MTIKQTDYQTKLEARNNKSVSKEPEGHQEEAFYLTGSETKYKSMPKLPLSSKQERILGDR